MWASKHGKGITIRVPPVQIYLKDLTSFPQQRQYPLRPKIKCGTLVIIDNLRAQVLLKT